ncbi:MAG: 2-hydroxyglutaryl-CoA dehydratase [Clostridiales bacterium]|nr:2-hydroxyglutaryl-CoA dehydratase [Clostridiales bacterium]
MRIGLDIGSTTVKCVALDEQNRIGFKTYQRHLSKISESALRTLQQFRDFYSAEEVSVSISGSAGMGLSEALDIPFVQEVSATREALNAFIPDGDVAIELGGEDAKILFMSGNKEVRMNGSCAGGTGAFIDQMASLLSVTHEELNSMASKCTCVPNIASRCGVFAKTDIQSLLNQGVSKEDISAGILAAVASQTISGLAQGRRIKGQIIYLGGPLSFLSELRRAFDSALSEKGICPEDSLYYVAAGAAMNRNSKTVSLDSLLTELKADREQDHYDRCPPLFKSNEEYEAFYERHDHSNEVKADPLHLIKNASIGIDAGSTTVKFVAVDENNRIFFKRYLPNKGNPVSTVKSCLKEYFECYPETIITSAVSTGYGEDIIKNAFGMDAGVVETVAHMYGAKHFDPLVDFIIDIGGQDIKCLKIKDDTIDNIFLNEACSSGCGSFLQTFADNLGYTIEEFSKLALYASAPVDLGSRCTVFMNSSVKQAQKCGASLEDIAAGLAISVVKNALYKVIRNQAELGKHIVVQGGTFLNDAVLRSFELETGLKVTRPPESALMGAYGAALYGKTLQNSKSSLISAEDLASLEHTVSSSVCGGCSNKCRLTVNSFGGGRTFISGNKCSRAMGAAKDAPRLNMYKFKRDLLAAYENTYEKGKPTIGIPMGLNNYELYPFWHTFFSKLGFNVITSPESTRECYLKGQDSIPSDTVCYPAKLIHGHIKELLDISADYIFYPSMTYNIAEAKGFKNYNCPVVAYYPELIKGNTDFEDDTIYLYGFIGLHNKRSFPIKAKLLLEKYGISKSLAEIKKAAKAAYSQQKKHYDTILETGSRWLEKAKKDKLPVIILAGRPYHIDPEINHGLDTLISDNGFVVLSEDSLPQKSMKNKLKVLNQWTYHSRMYNAAEFTASCEDAQINLIQLVSFGCGLDAITGDEVKRILESKGKIYTQLKIDEIANLGAAKIRLKSLYAAIEP